MEKNQGNNLFLGLEEERCRKINLKTFCVSEDLTYMMRYEYIKRPMNEVRRAIISSFL